MNFISTSLCLNSAADLIGNSFPKYCPIGQIGVRVKSKLESRAGKPERQETACFGLLGPGAGVVFSKVRSQHMAHEIIYKSRSYSFFYFFRKISKPKLLSAYPA